MLRSDRVLPYDDPNGDEHTFAPANPNMNALRVMKQFEQGVEVDEGDWKYFVLRVDGKPFEEAPFELQWAAYVASFDFLSTLMQRLRLTSSRR